MIHQMSLSVVVVALGTLNILRVGFWQNGFFVDFYFLAAGFCRGFCRRIVFSSFLRGRVPRKILQENPRQHPPNLYSKIPDTFLQRGRANYSLCIMQVTSHDWRCTNAAGPAAQASSTPPSARDARLTRLC